MGIVCEKGHDARKMMNILMNFIEEETLEYQILKEDMIVEIRRYISIAEEKGLKPENIVRRKKTLVKKEKRLVEEKERKAQLRPFVEMVENKQVMYHNKKI